MQKVVFLVLFFVIFQLGIGNSFALEPIPSPAQAILRVDYELPYPGLLPDSPIYFLRVLRDKAVGFLISDSLKKSEFDLLQADKRLNAGIFLQKKGNTALALSTVSKAENYFEESLGKLEMAKKEGKSVDEIEKRLRNALARHKQEIEILVNSVSKEFKSGFQKELERTLNFEKRLNR